MVASPAQRALRVDRERRLLAALIAAAEVGATCPGNQQLAELLGMNAGSVPDLFYALEGRDLITVERGTISRVVTILASGKRTAGTATGRTRHGAKQPTRQRSTRMVGERGEIEVGTKLSAAEIAARRVERDCCPRCGARGDFDCGHAKIHWGFGTGALGLAHG